MSGTRNGAYATPAARKLEQRKHAALTVRWFPSERVRDETSACDDQLVIDDWMETIGHLAYQDAYTAVVAHRRDSTEYLMPGHITRAVYRSSPQKAVTMSPEITDCGRHRWMDDGTCLHCPQKKTRR